jgi:hypothetical protein
MTDSSRRPWITTAAGSSVAPGMRQGFGNPPPGFAGTFLWKVLA